MALTVMAVLGVALTRILISDSRFVSRQDAMLSARQGARAALNTVVAELQMVGDSGLITPTTAKKVTVRVPYAFGLTCRNASGTAKVAALLPVDSLVYASAVPAGIAWRRNTGVYTYVPSAITVATTTAATDSALCRADSVQTIPGGRVVRISGLPASKMPDSLAVFSLYQSIAFWFGSSTDLPGRTGLWRQAGTAAAEELVTPFDTSAGFAFLVGSSTAATLTRQASPPGNLNTVRGLELMLYAASESAAQGSTVPETFKLKTRVMFSNKVS
ncbi:MAG: hypothetical protein HY560_09355 [Gemmatimonadetes bacterium]|nr:hypothetical protein [Gemmatimonadota bacterium]